MEKFGHNIIVRVNFILQNRTFIQKYNIGFFILAERVPLEDPPTNNENPETSEDDEEVPANGC